MKEAKIIIGISLIILIMIGIGLKISITQKSQQGDYISDEYYCENYCFQALYIIPVSIVIGMLFILWPKTVIDWLSKIAPPIGPTQELFQYLKLRLFGLFIITIAIISLLNSCVCTEFVKSIMGQ